MPGVVDADVRRYLATSRSRGIGPRQAAPVTVIEANAFARALQAIAANQAKLSMSVPRVSSAVLRTLADASICCWAC